MDLRHTVVTAAIGLILTFGALLPAGASAQGIGRDSAGIRIVESSSPLYEAWHLSAQPLLTIGYSASGPEYEFTSIAGAVRLHNGHYVVADRGSLELRMFDDEGHYIRTVGRLGGGPGEFRDMYWMGSDAADTVLVYDARLRRLSRFDTTLTYVDGTFVEGQPEMRNPIPVGRLTDGSYLLWTDIMSAAATGPTRVERPKLPLLTLEPDGQTFTTLGRFAWLELAIFPTGRGGYRRDYREFGRETGFVVWRDGFVAADNADWELREFTNEGVLRRIIRKQAAEVPIRSRDLEEYRAARLARYSETVRRRLMEDAERAPLPPQTYPAHAARMLSDADQLWVKEFPKPRDTMVAWSIFDRSGVWVSSLSVPGDLEPLDIDDRFVIVRATDADDVQFVAVYEVVQN